MNSCNLTFSITAVANALASKLSDDKLALAGAVFTQLGDTLTTISTQRDICNKNNNNNSVNINITSDNGNINISNNNNDNNDTNNDDSSNVTKADNNNCQ